MNGKSSSNKTEIRGYIIASLLLGKDPKWIFKDVCAVYGDKCIETSFRWVSKFNNGQLYLKDKQRPGAACTASSDALLAKRPISSLMMID